MFQLTLQLACTGTEISGTDRFSLKPNPTLYRDSDCVLWWPTCSILLSYVQLHRQDKG